jgi:precorrin-6B methylase 2
MPAILQFSAASSWAFKSIRRRGIGATLQVALSSVRDLGFDWRFGTDTRGELPRTQMEPDLVNRDHAVSYQATKARPFIALMQRLRIPESSTFVDVGCGKGKVLLLASQISKFARVIGLEHSPKLCEHARQNIRIFQNKKKLPVPIEVVQADAAHRVPSAGENVFFLYNPFDEAILRQFVDRLRESLNAHARQVWIIYSVPVQASVLDSSGLFTRTETLTLAGNEVYVYTNQ